jgi:hypothetical protein
MGDFRSFSSVSRVANAPMRPVVDPAGWTAETLGPVEDWAYHVTSADADEIVAAVASFRRTGLPITDVTRDSFPLDRFGDVVADVRRELLDGRGIVMLRDFPLDRLDREAVALAYLGVGSHIGQNMIQNASGHLLGHVRDTGGDYGVGRGYNTRAELRFHADGCEYVGLLCLQTAKSGGESRIASSVAVHNRILAERPDLVEVLNGDFYRTNNSDVGPGVSPWFKQPVFSFEQGYFCAMGLGSTIEKAQKLDGVPKLTEKQREAIAFYRDMVSACAVDIPFQRGDIQFLNNFVMLHSRRGFEDWPELERKRYLLRLWLRDEGGRPIPDIVRSNRSGQGIQIPGVKPTVSLDA